MVSVMPGGRDVSDSRRRSIHWAWNIWGTWLRSCHGSTPRTTSTTFVDDSFSNPSFRWTPTEHQKRAWDCSIPNSRHLCVVACRSKTVPGSARGAEWR
ncbi:hypothetical protein VTI74DRAFT_7500 [Chaetomium olivicolor]